METIKGKAIQKTDLGAESHGTEYRPHGEIGCEEEERKRRDGRIEEERSGGGKAAKTNSPSIRAECSCQKKNGDYNRPDRVENCGIQENKNQHTEGRS